MPFDAFKKASSLVAPKLTPTVMFCAATYDDDCDDCDNDDKDDDDDYDEVKLILTCSLPVECCAVMMKRFPVTRVSVEPCSN